MYSLKERLNEILIKNRVISEEQLKKALKIQREKGVSLRDVLVGLGFVSDRDLISALSQGLGIPPIRLSRFKMDSEILKLIPKDIAKKYKIVPVSKVGNMLTVATSDPLNVFTVDDLKTLTKMEIGTIITSQKEVEDVIEQYYSEDTHEVMEELIKDMKTEDIEIVNLERLEERIDSERLFKLIDEAPVVKLANIILENGIKERSSDILIEPMENFVRIRYRIDGILREKESISKNMHLPIVSRIKVMSNLDIAESRLPQDGRFKIKIDAREVDFRVSILPSSKGEKVALRILDKSQAMIDIEKLGFEKDSRCILKECSSRSHGMILVCGPTGSGKTTTLYSLLKDVYSPEKNLITVEDPVEYQLQGITQVAVRTEVGLTFARVLRSILRQDPDVIMIGEIRDFETVDIAVKSALTGHLVLSTLHTTTACGSVVRLMNIGVEPFLISASLIAIVVQRLVRKLCPKCKEGYTPNKTLISKLGIGLDKEIKFYRPKGCGLCLGTGYSGRSGICEVLVMEPLIRDMVLKRVKENELKKAARKQGMKTLREDGIVKVINGITSIEEILRVTVED